jgi:hypothetical protein
MSVCGHGSLVLLSPNRSDSRAARVQRARQQRQRLLIAPASRRTPAHWYGLPSLLVHRPPLGALFYNPHSSPLLSDISCFASTLLVSSCVDLYSAFNIHYISRTANTRIRKLLKERAEFLTELGRLSQILHGSWVERYSVCSRPDCKCHEGQRHGPRYYLFVNEKSR